MACAESGAGRFPGRSIDLDDNDDAVDGSFRVGAPGRSVCVSV